MRRHPGEHALRPLTNDRREFLRSMVPILAGAVGGRSVVMAAQNEGKGKGETPDPRLDETDLKAAREKLDQAGIAPLSTLRSAHYQAIGDAPDGFMRLTLGDCEQLALDYLKHFRERGFELHLPDRRLTVVIFRDNRSFGRFFPVAPTGKPVPRGATVQRVGNYSRMTNMLYVFDWRMVPMEPRSSHRNSETLAHEGVHQLTYNTGLLDRAGDAPLSIIEGLGMYGESRQVQGPSDLGRINLRRLEDLARTQRMISWIPVRDLLGDDKILQAGQAIRVLLAYAQSWLLVHYLMKDPEQIHRFRDYLKVIKSRTKSDHRLGDAQAQLGDLDALDRDLRRYAIRLHRSL